MRWVGRVDGQGQDVFGQNLLSRGPGYAAVGGSVDTSGAGCRIEGLGVLGVEGQSADIDIVETVRVGGP